MDDRKPKLAKQYAPITFGEPFNPKSVEGHHVQKQKVRWARLPREQEAEEEALEARQAAEAARLAARSPLRKLWDKLVG